MLDRIPELNAIASHPSINRALQSGNPHKLYRALWWGNLLGRFPEHKELVKSLLANRRLFLKPISGPPSLFTFNGIGVRMYGEDDRDPEDGTYIGTHFFTFIFMPLLPISQYLCTSDGSQYQFFGKVPFGNATYFWRQLVVVLGAVGILTAGVGSWDRMRHNDVTVASGLDHPVRVLIGERELEIPPAGFVTERFDVGEHPVVATAPDGTVLEEATLSIPSRADVVAWNVAGSAFLYESEIPYSRDGTIAPRDPSVFCGESFIIRDSVEYAFEDAPDEISLPESTGVAYRTVFDWVPGGWRLCANHMVHSGRADAGIALASRFGDLNEFVDVRTIHSLIVAARGRAAGEQWIVQALESNDGIELHRLRQEAASVEGRFEEMRSVYRAYHQDNPDSPQAVYLRARTELSGQAIPLIEEARSRWPDDHYLLRSHAWNLHHSRRFAEALPLWEELNSGPIAQWHHYQAEALIALGRVAEAHQALSESSPTSYGEAAFRHAVAIAAGSQPPPFHSVEIGYDPAFTAAYVHAWSGAEIPVPTMNAIQEPAARAAIEVISAMHHDGPAALQRYTEATEDIDSWMDTGTQILLLGEAVRAGDEALAGRIANALAVDSFGASAVRIVSRDATADDFNSLPFMYRSCAELAASRNPDAAPAEAARLKTAARRDEILESVVSHSLDSWAG